MNPCAKRKYFTVKLATTEFLKYATLTGSYRRALMTGPKNSPLIIDGIQPQVGGNEQTLILVKNNYGNKDSDGNEIWSGSDLYILISQASEFYGWQLSSWNPGAYLPNTFIENEIEYSPMFISEGNTNSGTEWLAPMRLDIQPAIKSTLQCKDTIIIRQVRLATTTNISLTGLQVIDGFMTEDGDRVLVKNQTNNIENGIYIASNSSWIRATDVRENISIITSLTTIVTDGIINKGKQFELIKK
jgi:hypothetical protein